MYTDFSVLGMSFYEIFICIGMLLALVFADKLGVKKGFSIALQKTLIIGALVAVVAGFAGAIIFQAFYNFMDDGVFVINSGTGMTFYGGLIFGIIAYLLVWFFLGKKMTKSDEPIRRFGAVADIAACVLPMAHGFGRLGCLFVGCCHGNPTDAWYGIYMGREGHRVKYVPIQLFEALVLFAIAAICFYLFFKRTKEKRMPLLPIYITGYAVWRFCVEFFRGDDRGATILPFLSPSQLVAVILGLAGIGYFILWLLKFRHNLSEIPVVKKKEKAPVVAETDGADTGLTENKQEN